MHRTVLLFGHGDRQSFNHALAERYARGLCDAGGQVKRIDLVDLDFDPVLRDGQRTPQPLEPDLLRVKTAIEDADHVAWVFPTYWASPPTVVRGLLDRLFLSGWAFRYDEGQSLPVGLLRGRSSRVILTMDSPRFWYNLVQQRCIHRSFGSGSLRFCGLSPVEFSPIYRVRELSEAKRQRWCDRIHAIGKRDALRRAKTRHAPKAALVPSTSPPQT